MKTVLLIVLAIALSACPGTPAEAAPRALDTAILALTRAGVRAVPCPTLARPAIWCGALEMQFRFVTTGEGNLAWQLRHDGSPLQIMNWTVVSRWPSSARAPKQVAFQFLQTSPQWIVPVTVWVAEDQASSVWAVREPL